MNPRTGGGYRSPPSLFTQPKMGGCGSLSKWASRSQSHTSGKTKFPFHLPQPNQLNTVWHKGKAHEEETCLQSVIHKAVAINEWRGKILVEINQSCLQPKFYIMTLNQWNRAVVLHLSACLTCVEIRCQHQLATLRQKKNLDPHKSFSMLQCFFFINLCVK